MADSHKTLGTVVSSSVYLVLIQKASAGMTMAPLYAVVHKQQAGLLKTATVYTV